MLRQHLLITIASLLIVIFGTAKAQELDAVETRA